MAENALRKRHKTRFGELNAEYNESTKPVHEQITDFIYPQGGRFDDRDEDPTDGRRRDENIIDSTATLALRTLKAGMYSFITSPANKWFNLTIDDKDLKEVATVKEYFDKVTNTLLADFGKSNFYTSADTLYGQLAAYGTAAVQMDADPETIFRFIPYTIGQYYLDVGYRNVPDTLYRKFKMRARNVVAQFGEENVSQKVKDEVRAPKTGSAWVDILHVQEPNTDRDVTKLDARNKPFLSTYHEWNGGDDMEPLRVSGYDSQPFAAPRWDVPGSSIWGVGPGEDSLGDVKMLQQQQTDKLEAVGMQLDGPVVANSESVTSINAGMGGITWVDNVTSGQTPQITPLKQVNVNLNDLRLDIIETQTRIRSVYFADILAFLSTSTDPRKTATQINAEQREQLRLMGPIVERLFPEFLMFIIDRGFDLGTKIPGHFPDPPEEIQGRDVKIEIISLISQAQRLTEVTPIEQLIGSAAGMAEIWPEVRDKINPDQAIDELADAYGAPPGMVNSDEVVKATREQQAAALEEQQQLEQAQQAATTAKQLSETDTGGDNALTALTGAS